MDRLSGRVVLITGSTGIAAATAERAAAEGASWMRTASLTPPSPPTSMSFTLGSGILGRAC